MDAQQRVAEFVAEHDAEAPPEFHLLDLVSEVGELAKDANESSEYGDSPGDVAVSEEELGDVLYSLLALAESLDVEAEDALDVALAKYEERIDEDGDMSSGE
jgi:NTP pyrophosphatase (non-canonical NTP hydrolase)